MYTKRMRKKCQYIAVIMIISLLTGILPASAQGVSAAETDGKRLFHNQAEPAAPSSAGAVTATPRPTITPSPTITPTPTSTPVPIMTAKPNASILLGDANLAQISLAVGDRGEFDIDRSATVFSQNALAQLRSVHYAVSDSTILAVSEDGAYQALKVGQVFLYVTGYDEEESVLFEIDYNISIHPDMTDVTLGKDSLTLYRDRRLQEEAQGTIKIKSSYIFDEDIEELAYDVKSSNQKMDVFVHIKDNVIEISCADAGSTVLTITLYGKEFKIQLRVYSVALSATSLLKVRHTSGKLKVKGYSGKVTWKSSRPAIVKVSKSGKIRAKKEGNAVISVKVGNIRLGCIVSVTTPRKKKAIRRAQRIARTSQYSQPRRMQKGYYDCSSLVWRAYSPYGYRFGANSAPTAAGEAAYMANHHKLLKGGFSKKNVENLKIRAGDLLFETGANNGRYKGIYHVEMIVGYEFVGWKKNNKPLVLVKWANRPDGYYAYGVGIVGRV